MGCCAVNAKMQMEIPFDNMEDYEKLKIEIKQFLSSKDPKEKESTLFYTFMLVFFLLGIVTSYLIIAYTHDTHLTRRLMPLMIIPLLIIEIPISLIAFSKKGDANEKKDD